MKELLLLAESWLRLARHYLGIVRLLIQLYQAVRWLIKLPGRAVSAYRLLRDFPERLARQIAGDFVFRIVRPVLVIGLFALVGTAFFIAAKG